MDRLARVLAGLLRRPFYVHATRHTKDTFRDQAGG